MEMEIVTSDRGTERDGATLGRTGDHLRRFWSALARRILRWRGDSLLILLDGALVVVAYVVMLLARYDLDVPESGWERLWLFLPLAIVVHVVANAAVGLYGPVWEQASIHEAQRLLVAGFVAVTSLTVSLLFLPRLVPLSVAIIGGGIAMGLHGVLRFQSRLFAFRRRSVPDSTNVLLVGAGASAASLLREIGRLEGGAVRAVALLDDDVHKQGRSLQGVPIIGAVDDLADVAGTLEVDQVLLAIPSAPSGLVRRVADATSDLNLPLKVLPSVNEFINGHPQLRDVRDLSIEDLLGRQQVQTDFKAVAGLVRGKRVLVTGGGGSIGSEICRQVARLAPERLVLVDRDETHLFDAAAGIDERCMQVLLDIRDRESLTHVFEQERPDIVFHAAAHKHVPILERYPCEAASINVVGTASVVAAARQTGVQRLVFISTDKAVNPTSVMGASKRIGEQLVLTGAPDGVQWCAVRFGNVLGSRGSVVPTFMRQISRGGPVTVTHPDVTRFFMSIPEAVQLVLQAAALAQGKEVFMLDMGEAVRIVDLANRMITLAGARTGVDIDIEVVGLRPGEKLTEELNTPDEHPHPTPHPKIRELRPRLLDREYLDVALSQLDRYVGGRDAEATRGLLFSMAFQEPTTIRIPPSPELAGRGRRRRELA